MAKPKCVILHPKSWASGKYKTGFDYWHVSIGGKIPRKRNGTPTFDGFADMAIDEGKRELEKVFEKVKPDLFLFWIHGFWGPQDLARLKKICPKVKMIFWFGNTRPIVAGNVSKVKRWIDGLLLVSKHPDQYRLYSKAGFKVGTLWDGFDPDEVPLKAMAPKYDCVFGGNSYIAASQKHHKLDFPGGKLRYDFICSVKKKFSMLVRTGYPKHWPFKTLPEVYHPHYTDFLRSGKICLELLHFPTFVRAYTRRLIRSIFSKRLVLVYYIPEMEKDFTNHKNIVWFRSEEEGIDLIRYYLDHDVEREQIAAQTYAHACKHFTFENRVHDFEKFAKRLL